MKLLKTLFSVICCFILISCSDASLSVEESSKYNPKDLSSNDYPFAEEIMDEVLHFFNENDEFSLRQLFSKEVSSMSELEHQIEKAMQFYEGVAVSHDTIKCNIKRSYYEDKSYTYKSIRVVLNNIITDNDNQYNIELWYVLVDDEKTTNIGITKIIFRDEAGMVIMTIDGGKETN